MAGDPATTITDRDVRGLAAKLKGLHTSLTLGEQALLDLVLRRATGRDQPADVEGFAWAVSFNPLASLDAVAAELMMPAGDASDLAREGMTGRERQATDA